MVRSVLQLLNWDSLSSSGSYNHTSRVEEGDKNKAHPDAIRKAIEEEIRAVEGQDKWRCAAVNRDARDTERIRIACRDKAELQRVKEAAMKTSTVSCGLSLSDPRVQSLPLPV
jgi:hypothetical protein